jgi:hypothetical protein
MFSSVLVGCVLPYLLIAIVILPWMSNPPLGARPNLAFLHAGFGAGAALAPAA